MLVFVQNRKEEVMHACTPLCYNQVCKPGSVFDSHLSRHNVAIVFKPPSRKRPGQLCFLCGVAPDRVCSDGHFHAIGCALTAPFHPYLCIWRRYISVALFLKLPSAGVTRYPALWSPDFPHIRPFGMVHATVQPGCRFILLYFMLNVKLN